MSRQTDKDSTTRQPIWFKRKTHGWGWTPATWQGWAILGVWTGAFISIMTRVGSGPLTFGGFFAPLIGITLVLLITTYLTGEKPRWQWGESKDDSR